MKRIRNLFILALLVVVATCILTGCYDSEDYEPENYNKLRLICSYELVAATIDSKTQVSGSIYGVYLLGFGGTSGKIETTATKVYDYWYKREDGGIIPDTINMASYRYPESVKIVIYEDDSTTPKVEIWRNSGAIEHGDGEREWDYLYPTRTEIRFTIPSGSFVNTYDFQGIAENSQ